MQESEECKTAKKSEKHLTKLAGVLVLGGLVATVAAGAYLDHQDEVNPTPSPSPSAGQASPGETPSGSPTSPNATEEPLAEQPTLPPTDPENVTYPQGATSIASGVLVKSPKAKDDAMLLEIVTDPQCPNCHALGQHLHKAMESLRASGDINVAYHFKTFMDKGEVEGASLKAANAMTCAADVGKLPEYMGSFYNNPGDVAQWDDKMARNLAEAAKFTPTELNDWGQCVAAKTHYDYIRASDNFTTQAGVDGTPTVLLGGYDVPDAAGMMPEDLQKVLKDVKAERAKLGNPLPADKSIFAYMAEQLALEPEPSGD